MSSLWIAMIAGLGVGGVRAQPLTLQGQKVTFECLGLTADRALEGLSKVCGFSISAAPTTSTEVLVISVTEAPVKELLDKIAAAASAEWQRDGDKWTLIRPQALAQKQQREHIARVTEVIRQAQERMKKQIADHPDYDEARAKTLALELEGLLKNTSANQEGPDNFRVQNLFADKLPAKMLFDRLAVQLDPAALAPMESGQRIVFSPIPTRMQRPLGKSALGELEHFAKNDQMLRQAYPGILEENPNYRVDTRLFDAVRQRSIEERTPTQFLVKVNLNVLDRFSIEVVIGNVKGRAIARSSGVLSAASGGSFLEKPEPAIAGEAPLEMDAMTAELTKALMTAIGQGGSPESIPKLSPPLRDILLNPEKHEIAELGAAAMLVGTAKARKLNFVGDVADLLGFILPMAYATGSTTPGQVLKVLKNDFVPQSVEESDGWLVVRPDDPYSARRMYVDRKLLGKLVRSAVSRGYIAIDEMADFAVQGPRDFNNSVAMPYLMLLLANGVKQLDYNSNPYFLRLHGSLSALQKQALSAGQKIQISTLTPTQRQYVNEIVFWNRNPQMSNNRPQKEGEANDYWNRFDMEPTVRYGNGLPAEAQLSMANRSGLNIVASGTYKGQYRSNNDFSLQLLANYLVERDRPGGQNWYADTEWTEFQAEDRTEYRYAIEPETDWSFTGVLTQRISKGQPVSSLEKLPAEIWKQIQDEVEKAKARRNGNTIPPRR